MNESIHHERRGVSPLSSQRKITIRPTPTTANNSQKKNPFQNNQSFPSFNEEPKQPNLTQQSKPFKIKKSDLQPPDPTAPIFIQFSKVVKQTANCVFRGIGCNRRDLRPVLDEAFDNFFTEFDSWWRHTNPQSQRKDPTPLDIEILRRQAAECNNKITPLRAHCHTWKSYKQYDDIEIPKIELQDIPEPIDQNDEEISNIQCKLIDGLDSFSKLLQQEHINNLEIDHEIGQIQEILQFNMEENFSKQKKLREILNSV